MENNTYENTNIPEAEVPQQPAEYQQTEENQQPAEKKLDFNAIVNNSVEKVKGVIANSGSIWEKIKAVPRKIWIMAGAGIALIAAVILVLSLLGNTYKTPVQTTEKLLNTALNGKSVEKIIDRAPSILNGFGESEAKKLIKIIKKSDQYKDAIEDANDAYSELKERLEDECGKNCKIKIKIEDKEELEKEDVREFRDQLRKIGEMGKELDDIKTDDYEDMAEDTGLSKPQVKDMVKIAKSFCKDCKSAKVSAGYELSLVITLTGSELDEPEETDMTLRVFKVDGRWVPDVFSLVGDLGGGIGNLLGAFR